MKKHFSLFLALLLSLLLVAGLASCKEKVAKATDFTIDASSVTTTVKVGDKLDISALKATVSFDDETTKDLAISELTFYNGETKLTGTTFRGLTTAAGTVEITVKYGDFSKKVTFTVESLVATKLVLDTSAIKTTVKVGDNINVTNLEATVTFDNGKAEDVTATNLEFYNGETKLSGTVFSGLTTQKGEVTITVKYGAASKSLAITVDDKIPTAFALNAAGKTMQVNVGASIDVGGLTGTVTYDDGSTKPLDARAFTFFKDGTQLEGTLFAGLTGEAGTVTITVYYGNLSDTVTVTVNELVATELSVNAAGIPWVNKGDVADFSSITATVTFNNGTTKNLTVADLKFLLNGTELTRNEASEFAGVSATAGTIPVTATYKEASATFDVTVKDLTVKALEITPAAKEVMVGGNINVGDLKATATYSDDSTRVISLSKLSFSHNGNPLTGTVFSGLAAYEGTETIVVAYTTNNSTETANLTVTVDGYAANLFAFTTIPEEIKTVKVGDTVDLSGIRASATLTNGTERNNLSVADMDLTFSLGETAIDAADLTKVAGTVTVTAEYRGKTDTFTITVEKLVPTQLTLHTDNVTSTVYAGDSVNVGPLTATVTYDNGSTAELTATDLAFYNGKVSDGNKLAGTSFANLTTEAGTVTIIATYTYEGATVASDPESSLKITVNPVLPESLELDVSSVAPVIYGDAANFGGITAIITYNNGTTSNQLISSNLTFTYTADGSAVGLDEDGKVPAISGKVKEETLQEKESLTVNVTAACNGVSATFDVVITINKNDKYEVTGFTPPESETSRPGKVSEFLNAPSETPARLVGDDNAFIFLPRMIVYDSVKERGYSLTSYETISTITFNEQELKTKTNWVNKTTQYFDGETLIATAYFAEGAYQFAPAAVGNTYTISILPREIEWNKSVNVTVEIVNGYNVYNAKDLAIIDNTTSKGWTRDADENGGWAENPDVWASIREEKGFTIAMSNATNAIVLQKDIKITFSDLPSSYIGTVERDLDYYIGDEVATTVHNAKRLTHDSNGNMFLYERISDSSFTFYGNYYTLDASQIPLTSAFNEVAVETDHLSGKNLIIGTYGSDFSNASLFRFCGATRGRRDDEGRATYAFENLNVIGNADTSQYVIYEAGDEDRKNPKPVNAGGFIFSKTCDCFLKTDNVNMIKCFIGYILEENVTADANYIKVTSSYQDAAFLWGYCQMTVKNSELTESGGPLFIMQHLTDGHDGLKAQGPQIPTLTVEDSVIENYVTGDEIWFASMGAGKTIDDLRAAAGGFVAGYSQGAKAALITPDDGSNRTNCLNLICLMMSNGSSAASLGDTTVQGYCSIQTTSGRTYILNRMSDSQIRNGNLIETGTAIINIDDTTGMYYMPTTSSFAYIGSDANTFNTALATGDFISFNRLGMGLILGIE